MIFCQFLWVCALRLYSLGIQRLLISHKVPCNYPPIPGHYHLRLQWRQKQYWSHQAFDDLPIRIIEGRVNLLRFAKSMPSHTSHVLRNKLRRLVQLVLLVQNHNFHSYPCKIHVNFLNYLWKFGVMFWEHDAGGWHGIKQSHEFEALAFLVLLICSF